MNKNSKVYAVLSYIGIFWLIGLLAAPQDPFARFHVNQGLVLFLAELIVGFAAGILGFIPIVGTIVSVISWVCSVLGLVLSIMGIVNSAKGQMKPLPIIGGITLLH